MLETSPWPGRLQVVWRWLLLVTIALELTAGSSFYAQVAGTPALGNTAKFLAGQSASTPVVLGVLALWTIVATFLVLSAGPRAAVPMAVVDLGLGVLLMFTQRTIFGAMWFALPVVSLFALSVPLGLGTGIFVLVLQGVLSVVKAQSAAFLIQPAFTWSIAFTGLAVVAGWLMNGLLDQEHHRRSLLTVIQTSHELGTSASREKVLGRVVQGVKDLFACGSCVIYLRESLGGGDSIMRVAESSTAVPDAFTDFDPKVRNSIVGVALREKQPVLLDDFQAYPREEAIRKEAAMRSTMVAPLTFEEDTIGAVFVSSPTPGAYRDNDLNLFNLLSSQVAVAVRNLQLHEKTATLAITDSLSGLFTHGYFQERLGDEILNAKKTGHVLSLMILDVDFFKKVNDTYGHPQGDSLLKQLGGLITELTRPTDILCRYGGDEFTIIMMNTNRISAVVIAERIRESVEAYEFVLGNQIVHISVSGGVASFPEDADTKKELIEKSDFAMYQAKQKGRNRVIFSS